MSDMAMCLNGLSYIPPNNEQNKPTQGDIGETSNELTQAQCTEFEELYASANEELYPGCDFLTLLKFMAKFLHLKVKGERLQSLYKSNHTIKHMTWHATGKSTENGLAADGFNLFGNLSQSYNMWSVMLTTYNLPSWLCMKETYFMLTLLIPGPKSLGKDIDVYLRHLIDNLKELWKLKGVKTINAVTGKEFKIRAMLLWIINDFFAQSSLSGWSGQVTSLRTSAILRQRCCKTNNQALLFLKQICARTLMEDDMVKAESQLIDILCNLEKIYPPDFFDIMIHLVIHLPEEALEGGSIPYLWIHDERHTTQNSSICSPSEKHEEMYYGQLEEILKNKITQILASSKSFKDQEYILAPQVKQVFYLEDMAKRPLHWKFVQDVNHKKFSNRCVIMDFATLNTDDQSTKVEAPPDIIVVNDDDDFLDDEDGVPHDLADSDDEVLDNAGDDDETMSVVVARGHGGVGGGDDPSCPPPRSIAEVWEAEKPPEEAGEAVEMEEGRGCAKKPRTSRLKKLWMKRAEDQKLTAHDQGDLNDSSGT
ncbi:reverse transcriptase domain-containing protein [Tanacetum coccineum]